MYRVELARMIAARRVPFAAALVLAFGLALGACVGGSGGDFFAAQPAAPQPQASGQIGEGQVKVGLILPLGAPGNAGLTAQSMRNAAELALSEFNNPDIQLLVKDDGGTAPGAQQAAQQLLEEGVEIILGPLFAHSVTPVGQLARGRGIPVIAFSTDANVAAAGVYLLSFLPESDVERLIGFAAQQGKRSFAAAVPDNPYGMVVEAAFKQAVGRRNGRIVALERYASERTQLQASIRNLAQGARGADAVFIPDTADTVPQVVQILNTNGVDTRKIQLLGSGLWEDPQIFSSQVLDGAWYAGPDSTGFRNFSGRFRARYNQDPVRTATLVYDAVALVAALTKTQGERRFSVDVLTASSGFNGVDGLFRFRRDGSNQRGLAVMRVSPTGGQIVSPAPRSFGASGT
ncbi:MAG: penicillin-binding protein activator [Hyphomicrobiales bacterium]|nr:penicillin-binding protein activator [Hyphomicrobiales bacterium]